MTTSTVPLVDEWAAHPVGKVTRALIAVVGMISAILMLLLAVSWGNGTWLMVLLAVTLAATSIRASVRPSVLRLMTVGVVVVVVPFVGQII